MRCKTPLNAVLLTVAATGLCACATVDQIHRSLAQIMDPGTVAAAGAVAPLQPAPPELPAQQEPTKPVVAAVAPNSSPAAVSALRPAPEQPQAATPTAAEDERLRQEEKSRRRAAILDDVQGQRQCIADYEHVIKREKEIGQVSGFVNKAVMYQSGLMIVECRRRLKNLLACGERSCPTK